MEDKEFLAATSLKTKEGEIIYSKFVEGKNGNSCTFQHLGFVTCDGKSFGFQPPKATIIETGVLHFAKPNEVHVNEKPKKITVPPQYKKLYKQLKRLIKEAEMSGRDCCQDYDNDSAADWEFAKASAFKEVIDLITIEDEQR